MLSHFNSKATEGAAKEFVDKYVAKYGKDTLNQFGAWALVFAPLSCKIAVWASFSALMYRVRRIFPKTFAGTSQSCRHSHVPVLLCPAFCSWRIPKTYRPAL